MATGRRRCTGVGLCTIILVLLAAGCGSTPISQLPAHSTEIPTTPPPSEPQQTPYPPLEPPPLYPPPTPWIIPTCTAGPRISPGPTSEPGQPTTPPTATPACRPQARPTETPAPTLPWPTLRPTPEVTPVSVAVPPFIPELAPPEPFQVIFRQASSFWSVESENPQPQLIVDLPTRYALELRPNPVRRQFSVSPDGQRLALALTAFQESPASWWTREVDLYIYDRNTDQLTLLVEDAEGPQWAPDGVRLAYYQEHTLWALDTRSDQRWIVFSMPPETPLGATTASPSWSPDGEWLALLYYPLGVFDPAEVRAVRSDGSGESISYSETPAYMAAEGEAAWSPDGSRLLYATHNTTQECAGPAICASLWIADADGANAQEILLPTFSGGSYAPQWSPDGQWIAWGSVAYYERTELSHSLWLIRPDGTRLLRLTDPAPGAGDSHPRWTPDGRRMVFEREGQGLLALDLADGRLEPLYPQEVDFFVVRALVRD